MTTSAASLGIASEATANFGTRRTWSFRLRAPHSPHGFQFGFLFRLVAAMVAVVFATFVLLILGSFTSWQLADWMIILFGLIVSGMVLLGEHLRSRVYERIGRAPGSEFEIELAVDRMPSIAMIDGENEVQPKWKAQPAATRPTAERAAKRILDVVVSVIALALTLPLQFMTAALVKFALGRHSLIVAEKSVGYRGRPFTAFRFRTKVTGAEQANDPRPGDVGRLLIKSGLRELPMLFNVLRGDMTLVGPPALRLELVNAHPELREQYQYLKPGMFWPRLKTAEKQSAFVRRYVREWSVWTDLALLARSVFEFRNDGAP